MVDPKSPYYRHIEKLFADGRNKIYPKNQLIHYEGDPLTYIYLVKRGFIKSYTILDSGDTRTMMLLSTGDIFPLAFSASMDWENYKIRYFYQALAETELVVLPSGMLKEHIEADINMMSIYMNYLAASNEAIINQLEVMKNKKAIDKVGLLLPYLVSKAGKQLKPDTYQLELKLSHQEIADLSGVTRETTTTLIKQLEKYGVIDQKHGKWRINLKNLHKVMGSD
jgi:CRP/FNR family transcriptional regulator, cyclic AMP receptor protein